MAQLGMVGLGRMGANIVRRLMRDGHDCVVYDHTPAHVKTLVDEGAEGSDSLADLASKLEPPRAVWAMVPAGDITEQVVHDIADQLESGDVIIDGGNSYYRDDMRRSQEFAEKGIDYIDCGTSGGVFGLERGFCLMIGGPDAAVERLDPIFKTLAPGVETAERTPGRSGDAGPAENGYLHCGPSGAGHFVKMVHNGIEYGMMAAYAEGLNILKNANAGKVKREMDAETAPLEHPEYYQFDLDIPAGRRGVAARQRDRLLATRSDGRVARRIARPLRLRGPGLGLRGGPLDLDRGDRGGRARGSPDDGPVRALRLSRPLRLRGPGPLGNAQAVRRPPGEAEVGG